MKEQNKYLSWGLTVLAVIVATLMLLDIFILHDFIPPLFSKLLTTLAPCFYGIGFAFLLSPIVNFFEQTICKRKWGSPVVWYLRTAGIIIAWVMMIAIIYSVIALLLPAMISSIKTLVANAETYYNEVESWVLKKWSSSPEIVDFVQNQFGNLWDRIITFLTDAVVPKAQELVSSFATGVISLVKFFYNFVIGMIVSVYLLATKERYVGTLRKLTYSLFKKERAELFLDGSSVASKLFSDYIRGDLLDSLIIGILCLIFSSIFRFPYAPLISVVVGVTNLIPFFGPFLGAIPSAFLILLANPLQCLYFVIFIVVLQQFDGNILKPIILGDSTGLNGFWIVVSILIGGSFAGILGMFLGVPLFACVYSFARWRAGKRLQKKGLPTDSEEYEEGREYGPRPPKKHVVPALKKIEHAKETIGEKLSELQKKDKK